MKRSGRTSGWLAAAVALMAGTGWVAAENKPAVHPAEKQGGVMTAEALGKAPGQNKTVWVSAPRASKLPVLDGTLHLDKGEWVDAPAVGGMYSPHDEVTASVPAGARIWFMAATQ